VAAVAAVLTKISGGGMNTTTGTATATAGKARSEEG
jgi:hypothetical protein